ncbi:MAG: hypothetical protein GX682_01245 [Clostridiaceae bacterium]|nr:hypothetical protein [Clostridiaceae bacterium]
MKYYIDLGSSIVKIYECEKTNPKLLEEKSILFKNYFSLEEGISRKNYRDLMQYIREISKKYNLNEKNTTTYAIGIWRKIPKEQLETLKADFNDLKLKLNILTKEEETFYFEKAIQGIYDRKKVLMININTKNTELIEYDKANIKNRKTLQIGIQEILNNFPQINQENDNIEIEKITDYILDIIKEENIDFKCDCGIFIGGNLKTVKYNLVPNSIFNDGIHEYMISYKDFEKKNMELLKKFTLFDLNMLMPENKKMIESVKAESIIAQTILKKANIPYIIPSDLNIINGIIKENNKF